MSPPPRERLAAQLPHIALVVAGVAVVAYAIGLAYAAGRLTFLARPSHSAVGLLVVGRMAVGTVFVLAMLLAAGGLFGRRAVVGILAVGLLARLVLLPTPPPLEDDYRRYLWEGGLTAHGHNPYRISPAEAKRARTARLTSRDPGVGALGELGLAAGITLDRAPQPRAAAFHLPLAQAAFAAAHVISPWRPVGWRLLLLAADVATALLVLGLLGALGRPRWWVALYAWNPLVLHEIGSAAHMDVLALPAVVLGLWLAVRRRPVAATASLAVGAGIALWPLVLVPVALRGQLRDPRAALGVTGVLALTAVVLLGAVALGLGASASSGILEYAWRFTGNESLFRALHWLSQGATGLLGGSAPLANGIARLLAFALFGGIVALLLRAPPVGPGDRVGRALLVLVALYSLSPTQLPWQFTWLAPLVALRPRASLLLWGALLPLSMLTYRWPWLVWAQHLPVLALLGVELYTARYTRAPTDPFHEDLYAAPR